MNEGFLSESKENKDIPPNLLIQMYKDMLKIRMVEEKVAELVTPPTEIICPCHLYTGQEAVSVGVCSNLRKDDYVFSTHRSHGHYLAKGGYLNELMAEIYGKASGCSKGKGGSMHISAPYVGFPGSSAIVAGTISLAVGAALSFSIRKMDNVSVAFFGDGAVDEGVFYESLNFASLKKLPVIFVCENNLYSTHMPIDACIANTEIYQIAKSLKVQSFRIEGNNVFEVYNTAKKAVTEARNGNGPIFIECMTYRWHGHVGPNNDIDKGLRSKEELDSWMEKCPVNCVKNYLLNNNIISESELSQISQLIKEEIENSVLYAKESPFPDEADLFKDVFKN